MRSRRRDRSQETEDTPNVAVEPMDLSAYSRDSNKLQTSIRLFMNYRWIDWLTLGSCEIMPHNRGQFWSVKSYFDHHTDGEHDSASIVTFDVIGLRFEMYMYGQAHVEGWIRADDVNAFRVPTKDWDPFAGGVKCPQCTGKDKHLMVNYLPPENPALYDLVRGRQIQIVTGFKWPKQADEE